MKANEIPEKIYINDFGSELSHDWHAEHCCESDIKYIRTDSFVEKAKKWFEEQNEWFDPNGVRHCCMDNFEDFRKAMGL